MAIEYVAPGAEHQSDSEMLEENSTIDINIPASRAAVMKAATGYASRRNHSSKSPMRSASPKPNTSVSKQAEIRSSNLSNQEQRNIQAGAAKPSTTSAGLRRLQSSPTREAVAKPSEIGSQKPSALSAAKPSGVAFYGNQQVSQQMSVGQSPSQEVSRTPMVQRSLAMTGRAPSAVITNSTPQMPLSAGQSRTEPQKDTLSRNQSSASQRVEPPESVRNSQHQSAGQSMSQSYQQMPMDSSQRVSGSIPNVVKKSAQAVSAFSEGMTDSSPQMPSTSSQSRTAPSKDTLSRNQSSASQRVEPEPVSVRNFQQQSAVQSMSQYSQQMAIDPSQRVSGGIPTAAKSSAQADSAFSGGMTDFTSQMPFGAGQSRTAASKDVFSRNQSSSSQRVEPPASFTNSCHQSAGQSVSQKSANSKVAMSKTESNGLPTNEGLSAVNSYSDNQPAENATLSSFQSRTSQKSTASAKVPLSRIQSGESSKNAVTEAYSKHGVPSTTSTSGNARNQVSKNSVPGTSSGLESTASSAPASQHPSSQSVPPSAFGSQNPSSALATSVNPTHRSLTKVASKKGKKSKALLNSVRSNATQQNLNRISETLSEKQKSAGNSLVGLSRPGSAPQNMQTNGVPYTGQSSMNGLSGQYSVPHAAQWVPGTPGASQSPSQAASVGMRSMYSNPQGAYHPADAVMHNAYSSSKGLHSIENKTISQSQNPSQTGNNGMFGMHSVPQGIHMTPGASQSGIQMLSQAVSESESLAANAEKIRTMTLQAKIQEEETLRLKRELEICQQQMARILNNASSGLSVQQTPAVPDRDYWSTPPSEQGIKVTQGQSPAASQHSQALNARSGLSMKQTMSKDAPLPSASEFSTMPSGYASENEGKSREFQPYFSTDNGIPSEAPMHHQQVERELDDDLMLTDEDCQPMPPSAQESGLRSGQQEYYFSDHGIPSEKPIQRPEEEEEVEDAPTLTPEDLRTMPPSSPKCGQTSAQKDYYFSADNPFHTYSQHETEQPEDAPVGKEEDYRTMPRSYSSTNEQNKTHSPDTNGRVCTESTFLQMCADKYDEKAQAFREHASSGEYY